MYNFTVIYSNFRACADSRYRPPPTQKEKMDSRDGRIHIPWSGCGHTLEGCQSRKLSSLQYGQHWTAPLHCQRSRRGGVLDVKSTEDSGLRVYSVAVSSLSEGE